MTPLSIIIVGAPRSGTYWVVDLLQTRFGIQFPSETHFIPLFSRYLWLWGDLSKASNRRRLLLNIYEFLQIWTTRSSSSTEYRQQIRQLSLLVTLDEGRADDIINNSNNYSSLVESLFHQFADIHGADASGDKSAHFQVLDPDKTLGYFPDAVMLNVIRDGRDVALSWMKQWFGPATVADAAQKWRDHVEVNRAWGHKHPSRYFEVRYEDLAADKETEIRRLESFLGRLAKAEGEHAPDSALAKALAETTSHSRIMDIVASENISKWKSEMTAPDILCFEEVAASTLIKTGYEASSPQAPASHRLTGRFSSHALRVAAKTALPLVLGLCSRMGFPALRLINRRFDKEWRQVDLYE